jgi:valyl-tRNA synthetase
MPFISEELSDVLGGGGENGLILAAWPDGQFGDAAAAEMDWVIRFVSEIRAVRAALNVPAGARIECRVQGANADTKSRLAAHEDVIARLARVESLSLDGGTPDGAVQVIVDEATVVLPLAGIIDVAAEQARLESEIEKAGAEIAKIDKKLGNEKFLAKAPEHVVAEQRSRRADAERAREKLADALARLGALE